MADSTLTPTSAERSDSSAPRALDAIQHDIEQAFDRAAAFSAELRSHPQSESTKAPDRRIQAAREIARRKVVRKPEALQHPFTSDAPGDGVLFVRQVLEFLAVTEITDETTNADAELGRWRIVRALVEALAFAEEQLEHEAAEHRAALEALAGGAA